jgi:hypothetical protein
LINQVLFATPFPAVEWEGEASITMGDGEYAGRGTLSLTQERMSSTVRITPDADEPLARPQADAPD